MRAEDIKVEIQRPGEGTDTHIYEYCPIQFAIDGYTRANTCPLKPGIKCHLGLSTTAPPKECPLRKKGGHVMRFSVIPSNK